MHHVEAHVAGAAYAQHGVEIGTVVVHQSAAFMHEACDFRNLLFKDTQRVRVRHHHAGDVFAKKRFEVFHVNRSIGRALHLYDLQTADGGRGRIGAVSRVGNDNLRAVCVAPFHVVRTYHHEPRQLTVSSGIGV